MTQNAAEEAPLVQEQGDSAASSKPAALDADDTSSPADLGAIFDQGLQGQGLEEGDAPETPEEQTTIADEPQSPAIEQQDSSEPADDAADAQSAQTEAEADEAREPGADGQSGISASDAAQTEEAAPLAALPNEETVDENAAENDTADASALAAAAAEEPEEFVEINYEPLKLIQNGNYEALDESDISSNYATSTYALAATAEQKTKLKARLNTALVNVDVASFNGTSDWCFVDVSDLSIKTSMKPSAFVAEIAAEVINENPDLFYAGGKYTAGGGYQVSGGYAITKIYVQYNYSPSAIKGSSGLKATYESNMQKVLDWVKADSSDAEKAKAVHDWLVRNVSYNNNAANQGGPENYGSMDPWTAYGAVVRKSAVCQGYSLAFISAMRRLGIEATFVQNTSANHGWNRVRLYDTDANGKNPGYYWFNLDVTWDDPLPDRGYNNTPNTTYFLKSDTWFKSNNVGTYREHTTWSPAGVAGTNTKYDSKWPGNVYPLSSNGHSVTSVSISPSTLTMLPDSTAQLTLNTAGTNVVDGQATWSSSNSAIAAVSSNGVVSSGSKSGTATITVKLGNKTATCKITVKNATMITGASVSLANPSEDLTYKTGTPRRPALKVTVGGKTLVQGSDYTITWPADTITPGVKTVTISGAGDYAGTKTFNYTIKGKLSSVSKKLSSQSFQYNGSAQKPTITLTLSDNKSLNKTITLVEGTDYSATWPADVTNAGTKTITLTGRGAWTGTATLSYTISPLSLKSAAIDYNETMRYTGSAITQSPRVTLNGTTIPASNYSVSYRNNVNVGTATMTITGKGNCTGSIVKSFKIISSASWERLWGNSQFETMQAIGKAAFSKSDVVIIATAGGFADALAASALAGRYNAPILMTTWNTLSSETRSEIQRLGAKTAYVCGGIYAVSDDVVGQIKAAGCTTVHRVAGNQADDTSREIGKAVGSARSDTVIIACQGSYQDALSISPYAYATSSPIILTGRTIGSNIGTLSSENIAFIKSSGFKKAIIVGGQFAVPYSVDSQLKSAGISASNITRLWGNSAYDTSKAIADWELKHGMGMDNLGVACGLAYPDALAGAALCGLNRSVLLLADSKNSSVALSVVAANKKSIAKGYVFGGRFAVPNEVLDALKSATK